MKKKIVLAGPPRSGKSCLREGLKQALGALPSAPYPFVITACPDGEGAWFQATVERSPVLAAECKAAYKSKFTPEFVRRIADSVKSCPLELCLIDIGGIPSVENEQICSAATHIVILAGDMAKVAEWHVFARKLGLTIVAEICSDYNGLQDAVTGVDARGVLHGSVHHLERGERIDTRPMVRALAAHILAE
jgi:CRISPR-associated protein Csx3